MVIPIDPRFRGLLTRHSLAKEMIDYYSRPDELIGPEASDHDVILPVGMELPADVPLRALFAVTPLEFWCLEFAHVMMALQRMLVPPMLLPAHAEDVVLLPAEIQPEPTLTAV